MKEPSKSFKEVIPSGEEEKFAQYAKQLKAIHKAKSRKHGKGRLLHRKGLLAIRGELKVDAGLTGPARQGIFSEARTYPVVIRLSNGSLDIQPDKKPDIRGFAMKVMNVKGKSVLTGNATTEQDFVMINHSAFSSARAEDFLDVLLALAQGPGTLIKHLIKTHGFFGAFKVVGRLGKVLGKKFHSFGRETFSTALAIRNGDYAAKLRIRPLTENLPKTGKEDLTADLREHLKGYAIEYAVELQFYTDDQTTPIEDGSAEWPEDQSPFVRVATLTLPPQALSGATYEAFAAEVEKMKFDPWNAIEEHRPLGNIMRARKHAYYASQQERGVA
jgi:catalase